MSIVGKSCLLLALAMLFAVRGVSAQSAPDTGWPNYGNDAGGERYSPARQIDRSNVAQLQVAWTWKAQNFGPRADPNYEVTPLAVNGILYFTAGMRRDTIAVDGATGETLWMYRLDEGDRGDRAVRVNNRGVALGLDASEHDPLAGLAVTTDGFRRIGATIARLGLPTVFVQEGGYLSEILGANLTAALAGFEEVR